MKARIVNIQKFSLHDGPGIRTLVFFKGCPLNCLWCDNPECINSMPEIGFNKALCNGCGKCIEVCPAEAIDIDKDNLPLINHNKCTACGECITLCSPKAMAIYGKDILLEELFEERAGLNRFKGHILHYLKGFSGIKALRRHICTEVETLRELRFSIEEFLSRSLADRQTSGYDAHTMTTDLNGFPVTAKNRPSQTIP